MKVIILNAPPHSGKDTIADLLKTYGFFTKMEFKKPMFDIAIAMSGMSESQFMTEYHSDKKEEKQEHLGGLSYREFMIHISEDVMKPLFGCSVFGDRAAELCKESTFDVVFADGGFIDEVKALHDAGLEVIVMRLHRQGFDFTYDSRDYLYPDFCYSYDIELEHGNPRGATQEILDIIYN